jgi:arabinogalactan oligomer/maltooligosaccharide transport system substrate-binding protein
MSKKLWALLSILLIAAMLLSACGGGAATPTEAPAVEEPAAEEPAAEEPAAEEPAAEETEAPAAEEPAAEEPSGEVMEIQLWTREAEVDGGLQFVQSLADAYEAEHPNVNIEPLNKNVEDLREDFQTASLAGEPPDLLWTVNDHVGPFTAAGLIQPVDDLVDLSQYVEGAVEAAQWDGQTWGVPIQSGNHLMLFYNKDLIPEPPTTTEEMIAMAKEITVPATETTSGTYGLVFNQTEPFWLVPWLGGYGGKVFADDGLTPTLNTPEMVNTLAFMARLKEEGIIPEESDYNGADALFKTGNAGMIVNGDWTIGAYKDELGDKLGVASLPEVEETGLTPAPYTSGIYFMIPEGLEQERVDVLVDFINFVNNEENQLRLVTELGRLPALKAVLDDPAITGDPILAGSALQMAAGTGMPVVLEMRCNWDAMKPEMQAVLAGQKTPEEAAEAMQTASETCIRSLE